MARNRPGKREREAAKRQAFQAERASIIARNLEAPKPERPIKPSRFAVTALEACGASRHGAPKGYGAASTVARDRLQGRSAHVGFVAPRGFVTPKDLVAPLKRDEVRLGRIAGRRTQAEREAAKALAATVKVPSR